MCNQVRLAKQCMCMAWHGTHNERDRGRMPFLAAMTHSYVKQSRHAVSAAPHRPCFKCSLYRIDAARPSAISRETNSGVAEYRRQSHWGLELGATTTPLLHHVGFMWREQVQQLGKQSHIVISTHFHVWQPEHTHHTTSKRSSLVKAGNSGNSA